MKSLGNIDLQNNMLLNTVLEQTENFPAEPKVGQFIFKGQRVMICIEVAEGLPVWAPLSAPLNTFIHDQALAATTWTVDHNLNTSHVIAQVVDTNGKHVIPDEVQCNFNQTIVTFAQAETGRLVLMIGNEDGVPRNNYSYEQEFATESTTWVVSHMLGYNPLIRVFVGNQEVQPLSIVHDDLNNATVTFTNPQTGYVRAV